MELIKIFGRVCRKIDKVIMIGKDKGTRRATIIEAEESLLSPDVPHHCIIICFLSVVISFMSVSIAFLFN